MFLPNYILPIRLDNIAVRSPESTVIIVGTHLDCISHEKYGSEYVADMEQRIRELVQKPRYRKKVTVLPNGIHAVSCAFGGSRAGRATILGNSSQLVANILASQK